jgi:hypothetical protein
MALERSDYLDPAKAPAGKRTVRVSSPNVADLTVIESVPISSEKYKPIPYGSPHQDYSNNGLILVWQDKIKAENNQVFAVRVYASRNVNQDWFNYVLHYSGDVAACPIFIRSYTLLRSTFTPAARGQPFKGVYQLLVTAQGTGYTSKPTVSFTGGGGSGATANAIMNETGDKVIGLELTSEGINYTSAPTVVFAGGGGSGAAATAFVQAAAAVLVKEETVKLDQEDPQMASLFIKVNRVYETLPGPLLIWDNFTDERGPVQKTTQSILAVGNEAGTIAISGATFTRTGFEPRGESAIVLTKMVETFTLPGPILTSELYEDEKAGGQRNRGAVVRTEQLIKQAGTEVATFTRPGGGKARRTFYEERKDMPGFVLNKIIEDWTEIVIHDKAVTSEFGGGVIDIAETRAEPGVQDPDEGLRITESNTRTVSPDEQIKTTKQLEDSEWPELVGSDTDPHFGIVIDTSKKVVPAGTLWPGVPVSLITPFVDVKEYDKWRSIQFASKLHLPLPDDVSWQTYHHIDLPSELLDVTASWDRTGGESASARMSKGFGVSGGPGLTGAVSVFAAGGSLQALSSEDSGILAETSVQVSNGVAGAIEVLFRHGYRGPALTLVTRKFFDGPPPLGGLPAVTKILPVTGSASLISKHTSFNKSQGTGPIVSLGTNGQLQTRSLSFGPFLKGSVVSNQQTYNANPSLASAAAGPDLDGESYESTFILPGAQGLLNVNIPASTPNSLPSGTEICIAVEVEEWRFNVWVVYIYVATVP